MCLAYGLPADGPDLRLEPGGLVRGMRVAEVGDQRGRLAQDVAPLRSRAEAIRRGEPSTLVVTFEDPLGAGRPDELGAIGDPAQRPGARAAPDEECVGLEPGVPPRGPGKVFGLAGDAGRVEAGGQLEV